MTVGAKVTCAWCGATAPSSTEEPPLLWTSSVERGGVRWYCERCSREHLRAIEGRLDGEWWG